MRGMPGGSAVLPDLSRYRLGLAAMIRTGSADGYRAFLREWADLHQRGVAERLITMDDRALEVRMARMGLSDPSLSDTHDWARLILMEAGVDEAPAATGIASETVSQSRGSTLSGGVRGVTRVRRAIRLLISRPLRLTSPDDEG